MKRILPLVIASALLVVGCNNKKPATQPQTPPELAPALPAPAYPEPAAPTPAVMPPVTPNAVAPAQKAAPRTVAPAVKAPAKTPAKATSSKTYTVKKGDTLSEIAQAHKTTIAKIKALNPKLNPDKILVGQKLRMP